MEESRLRPRKSRSGESWSRRVSPLECRAGKRTTKTWRLVEFTINQTSDIEFSKKNIEKTFFNSTKKSTKKIFKNLKQNLKQNLFQFCERWKIDELQVLSEESLKCSNEIFFLNKFRHSRTDLIRKYWQISNKKKRQTFFQTIEPVS